MKVLALNSSSRTGDVSKTEIILGDLLQGMREAGAEVEVVELRRKKIRYCIGCFTCWTKTPGVCLHKDDMTREIFPKYRDSDLVVLATPLFHYTVNAIMKTFIERTLPIALPFLKSKATQPGTLTATRRRTSLSFPLPGSRKKASLTR